MAKRKTFDRDDVREDQLMLLLDCWVQNHCKVTAASEAYNQKMLEHGESMSISREQGYPMIEEAYKRGYLRIAPPYNHSLAQRIVDRYGDYAGGERFRVSDVRVSKSRRNLQYVASNGAEVVMELIKLLGKTQDEVHVGIGSGTTSMYFARSLAQAIRGEKGHRDLLPRLAIHALTAGFDALAPERSPESFFGMFSQCGMEFDFVGMPAPPFVSSGEYQSTLNNPAVKIPFEKKHEIDIVVTALAPVHDEHGGMRRLIEFGGETPRWMSKVVGDVQYRPFSEKGPVHERGSLRAITLFELDELRDLAKQDGKYVVVLAGPCDTCGKTREAALKPVVMNDDLKIWTHLVMDLDTAEGLVAPWRPGS